MFERRVSNFQLFLRVLSSLPGHRLTLARQPTAHVIITHRFSATAAPSPLLRERAPGIASLPYYIDVLFSTRVFAVAVK